MYFSSTISSESLKKARAVGWTPVEVDRIPPPSGLKVGYQYRDQYTKIQLWSMTEFKKIVYIDSDTLVLQNIDELFYLPYSFNAAKDVWTFKWDTKFNAGTLVLTPSKKVYDAMLLALSSSAVGSRAEQDFMNEFFAFRWATLPYIYNGNLAMAKGHKSVWFNLWKEMKIIHYTMWKPWQERGSPVEPEYELSTRLWLQEEKDMEKSLNL